MHISNQKLAHMRTPALMMLMFLLIARLLPAQNAENPEVAQLLLDCRDHATQLSRDADELESLTRSNASWQSHAVKLEEMKDHVNAMGRLVPKLLESRDSASPWQQQAIDRMVPLLNELAANTNAAIQHLSQNKERPTAASYTEYLQENTETAHELSDLISSFWKYGQARAKLEHLEQKLEIASN
jgi:Na+/phosphate symporter